MDIKALLGVLVLWGAFACASVAVPKDFGRIAPGDRADRVAADEEQSRYPALDLEDLCKGAKNPKCEAIVDGFCLKSCNPSLCATHGSIRGMCRLMCEAEDLPPQCSKMGPSRGMQNSPWPSQHPWHNPHWQHPWNMSP